MQKIPFNVYLIGISGVGKTQYAQLFKENLGMMVISAGEWAVEGLKRDRGIKRPLVKSQEYLEEVTKYSLSKLKSNRNINLEYIGSKYNLNNGCVLDGMRNPYEFIHLFRPLIDHVVCITGKSSLKPTAFEDGNNVIFKYLEWLIENGLMPKDNQKCFDGGADKDEKEKIFFESYGSYQDDTL